MKINWQEIPRYSLEVKLLKSSYEICLMMKTSKIDKYVYRIKHKGLVLKFGMSADNSRTYGERLYRQIGHCESWGNKRLVCSSGSDWRIIEEDFYKKYQSKIDKNELIITIYDLTNYPFESINPWDEVYYIEQTLINQYKDIVGEKPIGNINDDHNIMYKARIKKVTFDNLFEMENL